ncbi:MAG TPA: zinc ribbon domain-containing protein [Thermoleophilaceae bacterium]|nr:zinc ribbon domain-containing protein [Thermoleophilaceae bacterium]
MHSLLTRLRQRADESAAGSAVPAGGDPAPSTPRPSARDRGAMRRRLRQLRRRREALLLELGALVFEMHRRGHSDDGLVKSRAEEIARLHEEEGGLGAALGERSTLLEVVAAGIAGPCPACGTLLGTDDRFCSRCGTARDAGIEAPSGPNGSHAPGAGAAEEEAPAEPKEES